MIIGYSPENLSARPGAPQGSGAHPVAGVFLAAGIITNCIGQFEELTQQVLGAEEIDREMAFGDLHSWQFSNAFIAAAGINCNGMPAKFLFLGGRLQGCGEFLNPLLFEPAAIGFTKFSDPFDHLKTVDQQPWPRNVSALRPTETAACEFDAGFRQCDVKAILLGLLWRQKSVSEPVVSCLKTRGRVAFGKFFNVRKCLFRLSSPPASL